MGGDGEATTTHGPFQSLAGNAVEECAGSARARFPRSGVTQQGLRSETEDPLNLVPDGEHEENCECHEHTEGDHEAEPRARLFTLAS